MKNKPTPQQQWLDIKYRWQKAIVGYLRDKSYLVDGEYCEALRTAARVLESIGQPSCDSCGIRGSCPLIGEERYEICPDFKRID
jgi:hypothetical protein